MAAQMEQAPSYPAQGHIVSDDSPVQQHTSRSSASVNSTEKEKVQAQKSSHDAIAAHQVELDDEDVEEHRERRHTRYQQLRPYILVATGLVILGWWISATILPATRHRWIPQTVWAWFFILVVAFRFIPNSFVTRPVEAVWRPLVSDPFFKLPYRLRLAAGWSCLLAIVLGSAFGFPRPEGTRVTDRLVSVIGLLLFQFGFWATSQHRKHVPWPTVIVGLFFQQVIALFVLKSTAGFDIFKWIATLAADFLNESAPAAAFFFDQDTINKHWFFVNTLSAIIFFIATIQAFYYLGIMQWIISKFAWFFFKTMNVSGAEAVVASASPFIGQGESACLVRPYVDLMTPSELHLVMTSGFSTISGSVFIAYINLGVPPTTLITASIMSIPASIAISKMRVPEMEEPVTRGRVVVDRGQEEKGGRPANVLHAFSKGATFGLIVAGQILTNVLTVLALIYALNGLLTWIGRGFGIHALTIQLVLGYIFYPVSFFMGVPTGEILRVSQLLGTKLVANEFVAYTDLHGIMTSAEPLSERAFVIASYALCGFANLGSLGIQIGVLSALAPSRAKIIARIAFSAMICGFLSTMQAAGIAGMLV
ncbi:hypothetical protein SISNIDRAFT_435467 [Sistotremastrum niveocremeum HHB9708]|uniref:H+/nucleoside cotransporter n=1 Tax=Sistotremastrum niveocremeum HHB9708 TaxID=1314777 RepID=A0A165A2A2_9AGAM|nr:hypothetical protein SISNIDRAFT_435467 [Sistotremastrum niveocremeum HHB9708]